MQTFRLFVSSPGDVMVERRRVENVVSRLNGEFAGVARLEAIRWETEFYQAYSTFQAQIPPATECDLVIGILKWRLGTELPPDFGEKLPDGQPYPSGTAYEILTAIEKRQKGEQLPDVYVFRFAGASPSVAVDDPKRERVEHDWEVLKVFFQQWFLTERGHFKAAFNPYTSEDDFEAQLEKLLRTWVADKVAGGRVVRWPIAVKGSPFCGLAAFGAKHTPVFFGRSADTARTVDLWREAGSRGSPYLLMVGASGSGKSSLVRAGVIPRLITPGVIKEVDLWRIAVMRPGDTPAGPFAALAAALMQDEAALPKEEEGRGPALPEIVQGDSKTPAELASVLQHAEAAAAIKPIVNALSRVGASAHDKERYGREVRCDLVLLIDQFEELFAASVSEADRARFVDLMAALVGTGRIWVAGTLRADFYARMVERPVLTTLKEAGATYDLASPGPVELAEIVRAPAEAAGLVFETDAATGERLDARLLRDAERPDMLPLVQLALSRLFEGRESVDGEIVLPLKVYERLGGLKGIVNEAGETALASLSEAEKAKLPRLLRQLAVLSHEQDGTGKGALTIRAAPLAQAAPDAATRKLLDALIAARLLATSGTEADAQVRLVHQRVLLDWARVHSIVADSADFYRIRDDLEESRRKWEAGKRRSELLLARGLPLAEAESIVGKYGDELTPEMRTYVRASRKRANRATMIAWGAAAVFLLLAIGAGIEAKFALDQQTHAEQQQARAVQALRATMEMANSLVFELGLDPRVWSLPADLRNQLFDRAIQGYDQVIRINPDDAWAYNGRGAAYHAKGELERAIADYSQAIALDPKYAVAYNNRGLGYSAKGDLERAIADHSQAIALNPKYASAYNNRGHAYRAKGDLDRAIADYSEAIALNPKDPVVYNNRGRAYYDKRDLDRAIADYSQAIALNPKIALAYANRGRAYSATGDFERAIADYTEAIALNPKDDAAYFNRGNAHRAKGDLDRAIADYTQSITLDPKYAPAYNNRGRAYYDKRDLDRAIADYSQAIALDPKYALAYNNRGRAYRAKGDFDRAIADYTEAIVLDPKDADAYNNRGDAYRGNGDLDRAIADFSQVIALEPRSASAYFQRALTQLYAGSLPETLADLDRSSELDPKYPYTAIWLDIVERRSHRPGRLAQRVTQIDMGKWPAPVIRLYLGQLTPADVLAAAEDGDAKTRKDQVCEAHFFIGELSLLQGKTDDAARLFRLAVADCPKSFTEWWAARAELKALGQAP